MVTSYAEEDSQNAKGKTTATSSKTNSNHLKRTVIHLHVFILWLPPWYGALKTEGRSQARRTNCLISLSDCGAVKCRYKSKKVGNIQNKNKNEKL